MIEWCILGALAGIIAGLIPGLHSNNIAVILAASPLFGEEAMAFMLSICITQSFTEFIPALLINAPSENTFESVLPLQRLAMEGKAFEGICFTTFGAISAVIIGCITTPLFFLFIEQNSKNITTITPFVLAFALIVFIKEGKTLKDKALICFVILAAAMQGMLFENGVFPLITGYFGVAGTLLSLNTQTKNTIQTQKAQIDFFKIKEALVGVIGGAIVSVMPGIGSNTAGGIIKQFRENKNTSDYLVMLGAISASNFFFSFATMLAISKTRNGAMLALLDKLAFTQQTLINGTLIMLFAAGIGGIATMMLSKHAIQILQGNKQKKLGIISIILMTLLVALFNGLNGFIAMITATALGVFVIKHNIKRSTCMSALIVPAMLFYLFILI
jgi:putative membrane protein